ncbi:MAG TPA: hypothetical protein DF613_06005 [Lachnospiraceae bacterium]|nr:hypothetical protein [Lachnospiraceae bacterium]
MRKKGILMMAALMAAALMAGCSSSAGEDTDKALEDKKAVGEAAGASSVIKDTTGDYAGENNVVHTDYLPSEYVTLGDYKGLSVNKVEDVTELSEDEKQSAVEDYLDEHSTQEEITDRPAAEGDYVAVKYKESRDGQVVNDFTDEETEVLLGEGYALFEDKLYGTSAGDKVTTTVPMENEEGTGTVDLVYDIEVVRIYSYKRPEMTDAFAKEAAGVDTVKELEEQIYQEIMDSNNEINRSQMRDDLITVLLENSTVNGYPQSLYDSVYQSVDMSYQMWTGMSMEEAYEGDEEAIKEEVIQSVNEQLIVEAVAEAEKLIVTQEELDSYKESILEESGYESVESLSEDYSDQELAYMLVWEKVGLLLEENANVTEITEEEYENLNGEAEDIPLGEETEGSETSDEVLELTQSELEALFEEESSGLGSDMESESGSDLGEDEETE